MVHLMCPLGTPQTPEQGTISKSGGRFTPIVIQTIYNNPEVLVENHTNKEQTYPFQCQDTGFLNLQSKQFTTVFKSPSNLHPHTQ